MTCIGAERTDQLDVRGAAHAGDLGTERLGELHGERPHAARGAVDQDPLPCLDAALVTEGLEGRDGRDRDRRRLLKGEVGRLGATKSFSGPQTYSAQARLFSPNTSSPGLNSVTSRPTASTTPATSTPGMLRFGVAPARCRANDVRLPAQEVPVERIDRRRVDADQHLAVLDGGLVDVLRVARTSGEPYLR